MYSRVRVPTTENVTFTQRLVPFMLECLSFKITVYNQSDVMSQMLLRCE